MIQDRSRTRYAALIDVREPDAQNIQEFSTTWGEIRQEFREHGADLVESYAVLGEYDFLVVFDADRTDDAFRTDVILERHGLDVQTMEILPTEQFATLVEDA